MSEKNYLKEALLMLVVGLIIAAITNKFFIQKVWVQLPLTPNKTDSIKNDGNTDIIKTDPIIEDSSLQTEKVTKKNDNVQYESIEITSPYINSTIINSHDNVDICVTIIDENEHILSSVSSDIANIYEKKGEKSNSNLLRSSFVLKNGFQELFEGNSDLITKLNLIRYTDYLALGKISFLMRQGTLVEGTVICTASITMNLISADTKTITKSFSFSVNGNGVTESQAKEYAIQNILDVYYNEHSSL